MSNRDVSPSKVATGLPELWSPRVVAEVDNVYVKVAKVEGTLAWHAHENEDELFYVLKGVLLIEMEDRTVELREGDSFVVPKGVRHNPISSRSATSCSSSARALCTPAPKSPTRPGPWTSRCGRSNDDRLLRCASD